MHSCHIQTLDVHVILASKLCSGLHRVAFPRLQKFQLFSDYALEDLFEMEDKEYGTSPIHMLEHSYVDTIPTFVDLQQWSTSKYPTLTHVTCSGIPLEWEFFSPLNLGTLRLCIGVQRAPSMVIMGNRATNEVRFAIRVLPFLALQNLIIKCPLGSPEGDIFISLINYLPLDELHELKVPVACFREEVLPDPDLVREGNITEESSLMKLQFIR
ncbi:hypothetical protein ARMGADRAFT_1036519 [Armillaria gallica]|uniref:Uncharacterized protein n=1 Tax=Armillaria gallica TaxID=47427 RepID=A0A2H3DCN1_ARMGA|nr:hypothetical protein ARMGADRAFT_1036519 [Armillaria gallica]